VSTGHTTVNNGRGMMHALNRMRSISIFRIKMNDETRMILNFTMGTLTDTLLVTLSCYSMYPEGGSGFE
jgi:hypothetical protein